ncbi:hypothetical protein [Brevundimonas sp.]|uniref:hypothetical protein n=1 Tax=Brevundimonas sp. TaxID=1871086 RepID=UPI0025BA2D7F|nr:hypothetical protein [Brevundimonas sp.]
MGGQQGEECKCGGTGVIGWGSLNARRCSCGTKISRRRNSDEWPAEREVGRAVYERIEKLIGAKAGTPECNELAFLAFIVESVEEVGGYDGPFASILAPTTPARAEAQDEGAEMTRLLKLADSALANVTAFEDDARYIMGNTNYAITENARSEIRSFLLAQSAKTSVRPKALEILERLLDHSGARGSFDAMKHGDAVKDAEELLRSARSPGHTDLMVTPESIDAYMRVNPMEAQDEGAAGERADTAFKIASDLHAAYEQLIYGLPKYLEAENLTDEENMIREAYVTLDVTAHRLAALSDAHPSPTPAADADRVRIAVEALEVKINAPLTGPTHGAWDRGRIAGLKEALAALKSTAAKEGGA